MERYIGIKAVNAVPMTRAEYNALRGWELPANENGDDKGYLVEYVDGGKANTPYYKGYVSWSPEDVFKRAYRPARSLSFGLALEALKAGARVVRAGWNGKGMWLKLKSGPDMHMTLPYVYIEYPLGHIAYPNGSRVPWLASQTDMLSEDWEILP